MDTIIPKKIHFCWFGGKNIPQEYQEYILSWKKFCPDYEIIRWDETNFDFSSCAYVKEAYDAKYWAFVSDYARFKILYENGGVCFDTDVEVLKPIDNIVAKGPFMGMEYSLFDGFDVAPGLGIAFPPHHPLIKEILVGYESRHFVVNGKASTQYNVCAYVTDILRKKGLSLKEKGIQEIEGVKIYPTEFFCPIDFFSRECIISDNTYTNHHYSYTWSNDFDRKRSERLYNLIRLFGRKIGPMVWYVSIIPGIIKNKILKEKREIC